MIIKTDFRFGGFSLAEKVVEDDSNFNTNGTGLYLGVFCSLLVMVCTYFKIPILAEFIIYGIIFVFVTILASRSSLYCLCIPVLFRYIFYSYKIPKSRFVIITAFALYLIVAGYSFVMNKTYLGERILSTETQMRSREFSGTFLSDIFGDRAMYYYDGWRIFTEHPISGVGNNNYINYNSFGPFVCHVEFMKQFSENGIIGAFLFFSFFLFAFIDAAKAFFSSQHKDVWLVYFQAVFFVFIVCSTSYISSHAPYYLLLGISCSFFSKIQKDNNENPILH